MAVWAEQQAYSILDFCPIHTNKEGNKCTTTEEKLELVCCKKQQKKVSDQLLVCGIGELRDLNDSKLIVYESK